jgi:hypothetical protein
LACAWEAEDPAGTPGADPNHNDKIPPGLAKRGIVRCGRIALAQAREKNAPLGDKGPVKLGKDLIPSTWNCVTPQ